jgi:DNA gyrase/topoisomerase IV subunit B
MADDSLTVREAVRKRPGMYVGSTGPFGVECLAHEVLENSLDLILGGRATTIAVISRNDRSIEVRDNGPGLDLADREVRKYFEEYHDNETADGHHPQA